MTSYMHRPIDDASPPALFAAFSEACALYGIAPDGDDGTDLTTVLWHAFSRGLTTKEALAKLVLNLVGK